MRTATIGDDGILRDADGVPPSCPCDGDREVVPDLEALPLPQLVTESIPPEKTAARVLAEKTVDALASSLTYKDRPGNPKTDLYPGRIIIDTNGVSVYAVSFRLAQDGSVYLFSIDGPDAGNWKEIKIEDLSAYAAVSEPEANILWNVVDFTPKFPEGMTPGALWPIAVLSGAMATLSTAYPVIEDEAAWKAAQPSMGPAALAAVGQVMLAVDGAGASYDSLSIGRKALALFRRVCGEFLNGSIRIVDAVLADDFASATAAVRDIEARYPYWGALLERAYLWTQLNDMNDAAVGREQDLAFMIGLQPTVERVKASPELRAQIAKELGITQDVADFGIAEVGRMIDWTADANIGASIALNDRIKNTGTTEADFYTAAYLIPALLGENQNVLDSIKSGARGEIPEGFLGVISPALLAAAGGGPKTPIPPEYKQYADSVIKHVNTSYSNMKEGMTGKGKERKPSPQYWAARQAIQQGGAIPTILKILVRNVDEIRKQIVALKKDPTKDVLTAAEAKKVAEAIQAKSETAGMADSDRVRYKNLAKLVRSKAIRLEPNLFTDLQTLQETVNKYTLVTKKPDSAETVTGTPINPDLVRRNTLALIDILLTPTRTTLFSGNPLDSPSFPEAFLGLGEALGLEAIAFPFLAEAIGHRAGMGRDFLVGLSNKVREVSIDRFKTVLEPLKKKGNLTNNEEAYVDRVARALALRSDVADTLYEAGTSKVKNLIATGNSLNKAMDQIEKGIKPKLSNDERLELAALLTAFDITLDTLAAPVKKAWLPEPPGEGEAVGWALKILSHVETSATRLSMKKATPEEATTPDPARLKVTEASTEATAKDIAAVKAEKAKKHAEKAKGHVEKAKAAVARAKKKTDPAPAGEGKPPEEAAPEIKEAVDETKAAAEETESAKEETVQGEAIKFPEELQEKVGVAAASGGGGDGDRPNKISKLAQKAKFFSWKKVAWFVAALVVLGAIIRIIRGGDYPPPDYRRDYRPTDPGADDSGKEIPWTKILLTSAGILGAVILLRRLAEGRQASEARA